MIPVLDLHGGRAVLARGGRRDTYEPVQSVLVPRREAGNPLALARAYRQTLGCDELYIADLDAIAGGAVQQTLLRTLAGLGNGLLVDAGVSTPERARDVVADGARRVVVGLETLSSFEALRAVVGAVGGPRVAFSLDLRAGTPIVNPGAAHGGTLPPIELARAAVDTGVGTVIVLDLARVGGREGVDWDLVRALRGAHPGVALLAGGGVGGMRDLERLAHYGIDGALVATALHDGTLTRNDIATARRGDHAIDS